MKKLNSKTKSMVKKGIVILSAIAFAMLLVILLARHFGWTSIDKIRDTIQSAGVWSWGVFILLQVLYNVLLFIIPGQTMTFIAISIVLFPPIESFILVTLGMMISSIINYFIGYTLGERIVRKIAGDEVVDKYQPLLVRKAKIYYPIFMLMPAMPDDEIVLIAGLSKMPFSYFSLTTLLTRSVGIATTIFIGNIIPWHALGLRGLIVVGIDLLIAMGIIIMFANMLEKVLEARENKLQK
ncbi:MAG: VTT domain-containing protein [Bacilli bacterium]|jgi:uncharacterized membrane protein YdjX (TVP38/TMEM64 family)|nr:VTT domain-containing protein [Bacilli bacterium]